MTSLKDCRRRHCCLARALTPKSARCSSNLLPSCLQVIKWWTLSKVRSFVLCCRFVDDHLNLDLIRHGKHHNHAKHEKGKSSGDQDHSPWHSAVTQAPAHLDLASPNAHQAAAIIVDEERDAQSRMPVYRGLENFKLTDKMGECALYLFPRHPEYSSTSIQRSFFKRLQGLRSHIWHEGCRRV